MAKPLLPLAGVSLGGRAEVLLDGAVGESTSLEELIDVSTDPLAVLLGWGFPTASG